MRQAVLVPWGVTLHLPSSRCRPPRDSRRFASLHACRGVGSTPSGPWTLSAFAPPPPRAPAAVGKAMAQGRVQRRDVGTRLAAGDEFSDQKLIGGMADLYQAMVTALQGPGRQAPATGHPGRVQGWWAWHRLSDRTLRPSMQHRRILCHGGCRPPILPGLNSTAPNP